MPIAQGLLPGGRSRAFVNDTPVTLPLLRELAEHLVDIHSQHQNMQLTTEAYQLDVLDILGNNGELLSNYRKAFAAFREALKSIPIQGTCYGVTVMMQISCRFNISSWPI